MSVYSKLIFLVLSGLEVLWYQDPSQYHVNNWSEKSFASVSGSQPCNLIKITWKLLIPRVSGPTGWGDQSWVAYYYFLGTSSYVIMQPVLRNMPLGRWQQNVWIRALVLTSKGLYSLCVYNWDHVVWQLTVTYMIERLCPLSVAVV